MEIDNNNNNNNNFNRNNNKNYFTKSFKITNDDKYNGQQIYTNYQKLISTEEAKQIVEEMKKKQTHIQSIFEVLPIQSDDDNSENGFVMLLNKIKHNLINVKNNNKNRNGNNNNNFIEQLCSELITQNTNHAPDAIFNLLNNVFKEYDENLADEYCKQTNNFEQNSYKPNACFAPKITDPTVANSDAHQYVLSHWDILSAIFIYISDPDEIKKHANSPTTAGFLKYLAKNELPLFRQIQKRFGENHYRPWRRFVSKYAANCASRSEGIVAISIQLAIKFESLIKRCNKDFIGALSPPFSIYNLYPIYDHCINTFNQENVDNDDDNKDKEENDDDNENNNNDNNEEKNEIEKINVDDENYTKWHEDDFIITVEGIKQYFLLGGVSYSDMRDFRSGFIGTFLKFIIGTFGLNNLSKFGIAFIGVIIYALTLPTILNNQRTAIETFNAFFELLYFIIQHTNLSIINISSQNKFILSMNFLVNSIHSFPQTSTKLLHTITFSTISTYRTTNYAEIALISELNDKPVDEPTTEKFILTQNIAATPDAKSAANIWYPIMAILNTLKNAENDAFIFGGKDNDDDDMKVMSVLDCVWLCKPSNNSHFAMVVVATIQRGYSQKQIINSINQSNDIIAGVYCTKENWMQQHTINYFFKYLFQTVYKMYPEVWSKRAINKLNQISIKNVQKIKKQFKKELNLQTNSMINAVRNNEQIPLQPIQSALAKDDEEGKFTVQNNLNLQRMFQTYIKDINRIVKFQK